MTKSKVIQSNEYKYKIDQRGLEVGGGWRLKLFENDIDVGGGVFPLAEYTFAGENADVEAYNDALAEATRWLASRPRPAKKIIRKFNFKPKYWRDSYDLQEMIYEWSKETFPIAIDEVKILSVDLRRPYVVVTLETTDIDNGTCFVFSLSQDLTDVRDF